MNQQSPDLRTPHAVPIGFDLRVVHLLHSRVLHDLAGPIGAIANGLELARETGAALDADAMQLVGMSARDLADRLRFYRVAFGLAPGSIKTLREARDLLTPAIVGQRAKIVWPEADGPDAWPLGDSPLKLLLNMIVLGVEMLPRGGTVEVFVEPQAPVARLVTVASGAGVRVEQSTLNAIFATIPLDALRTRNVQAFFAGRMAEALGSQLTLDYPQPSMLALRAAIPVAAD
jgi:histidine phosphotransferase ChpT